MKKHLGAVKVCGLDFQVYEADAAGHPNLNANHGVCYPTQREIYLDRGMGKDFFEHILLHEVIHGIWSHSGLETLDKSSDDYEEQFIKVIVPHLIAAQKSMKVLKR